MNSDRLALAEDSDSDGSEVTANSTSESNDESLGDNIEVAKILDQKFHLPKELCEHSEIFREFFSIDTWNQLSGDERSTLSNLLPTFPENDELEKQQTVQQLFANTLTRFNQTPLDAFHNNLQDGNYRPDIAHYRKSILKAEEREQRIRECERISLLAEKLVCSREKLLRSAYRCPAGSFPQLPHSSTSVPRLSSSSATMRANRRYFQEISKLTEELGFAVSDDETIPEGMQTQLTKKQIKQFSEQGSLSPGAETRIISTTSTKEKTWDHLTNATVTDSRYKTMLQSYRKRKMIEPDHPDMEIEDIKLKDICSRTQLSVNPKKLINATATKKSMLIDTSRIKQETPTYTVVNRFPGNQLAGKNMKVVNRNIAGRMSIQERSIKRMGTPSETDEEDWIKTNIIKVEPKTDGVIRIAGKGEQKLALKQTKIKTIYPQHSGNVVVNRKRPIVDNSQMRAGKKIIIDASSVIKNSFVTKAGGVAQNKRIVINSRPTIVMDPNDLIDETDGDDIDNSPESRHELQACFLSLIRDIFCSTRDHRMKLEELRHRINVWLSNPIASMNEWFQVASDWGVLLISAVHFLSGEFQDQPDDFVPYLEFKSQLNIYQWIGAGRDTDARMKPLCQYWLSRRNEMGIKAANLLKPKTLGKTFVSPEKNEENHLQQAVSPPNARCRTDWKVQQASEEDLFEFQSQERQRYENPHLPFTYRQHGYESVVGPIRGIYSQSPAATKARDHNTLIADRPNFVTILALVRDAAARLPNGEGTRWDICELLKSSQYIAQGTTDVVIQSIVSGALDRMHTEFDPCIKYDTKRKLWIYVHRNRTESEFERLHLQQQEINRQKKPVFRKTKLDSPQQMITISSSSMRVVPSASSGVRTYQTKAMPSTSNTIKSIPALSTFENKQRLQNQSSPPPLKISPKRYIKVVGNERSMEAIDVEASLDAHTTPIVKSSDPKTRISLKNVSHMSPMRIMTSSPATSSYVQSSPVLSGAQSIFINSNRSQSPKVGTFVNARKIGGKPVIIGQKQAPPLVSQSSPNTSQSYLIPTNTTGAKFVKSDPPSLLTVAGKSPQFQQKNFIKVNQATGKNVINPQQKIILTAASALQGQKGGKIISNMTVPKSQSPVTMLSQQKQILTNVIVQQQKAKGQNQILMAGNQQKMPGLTISTSNANSSPQVIQIQQSSADGKLTTVSPANLTPQQRQTIFQSLKQFKQGNNQQTMIVKPQIVKSVGSEVPAPPLVSVSGSVGKIIKSGTTTMVQQPQVIVSMAQKVMPKTTFKIAGGNAAGQSGSLIQISGTPGSPMAQYAVVSKGKNIISLNQTKMVTTQANTSNQNHVTSTGNVVLSQAQIQQMSPSQQNLQTSQHQPIKIVQSGSITAQQLIGAKLINVQSLANKGIKTGGIKMINSQNYIANIGGKPLIIANKGNTAGVNTSTGGQGLVLQASNSPNGTYILNSQGQQLKVQGNILSQGNVNMLNQPITSQPQTVMLGNQIVKVQSINQMQHKVNTQPNTSGVNTQDGQRPIILGSTIKVLKNVIKSNTQPQQQQRVVLAAPGSQSGQFSQQIILPANFQGLKSLQGLKVIPMGQQGSSDRVFTTRIVTNSSATAANNNNSNSNANKPVTNSQEEVKE